MGHHPLEQETWGYGGLGPIAISMPKYSILHAEKGSYTRWEGRDKYIVTILLELVCVEGMEDLSPSQFSASSFTHQCNAVALFRPLRTHQYCSGLSLTDGTWVCACMHHVIHCTC